MTTALRKYNPGFASDAELVQSFCVRMAEFEAVVQTLRECTGNSNPHLLVIGPRGSGKTTLLLRAVAEVRRDEELSSRLLPVVFPEESYRVSTCGEFWLECLAQLADQAPADPDGPDLRRSWEDLRTERDDRTLEHRCLAAVLEFAKRIGKRLVLVVENLNMLFADMADADAGWRLRHTLQTEAGIVLLASATSRFDQIDDPDQALYEQFTTRTLRPLGSEECARLWEMISGNPPELNTIRPLEILTGGSPRLLAIVARFGAGLSFRELMDDLLDLVDEHTEYFKSHLEAFPAQERRVYLALAELWRPATTREIADCARIDTNKCSAFLKRLVDRGVVAVSGGTPRRKRYYLTERMYNIYYLLRSRRGQDAVVEALIQFMSAFYSQGRLWEIVEEISTRGAGLDSMFRHALIGLLELPKLDDSGAVEDLELAELFWRTDLYGTAVDRCDAVIARLGSAQSTASRVGLVCALQIKADALGCIGRWVGALSACDLAIEELQDGRSAELVQAIVAAHIHKGMLLHAMGRTKDALAACDRALAVDVPNNEAVAAARGLALGAKALILAKAERLSDALEVCEDSTRLLGGLGSPFGGAALLIHGILLADLGRNDEARMRLGDAVERLEPQATKDTTDVALLAQYALGLIELRSGRIDEANALALRSLPNSVGWQHIRSRSLLAAARAEMGDALGAMASFLSAAEGIAGRHGLPSDVLELLQTAAPSIGLNRMVDGIEVSPAADLLLPLSTALHQELGHETHVAQEVDEVAQDIRRSLADLRTGESSLAPSTKPLRTPKSSGGT